MRYSTLPPLNSATARATSVVTVPVFGFGIRPRGPSARPNLPTSGIMSGVAIAMSKSILPFSISAARSSLPTMSAPASRACLAASPAAKTAMRTDLPVPDGIETVPRTLCSVLRGSRPKRTASSTVSSNFALAKDLTLATASAGVCSVSRS